jgi:hypothetical protein
MLFDEVQHSRLTTQAQRPGPRGVWIATRGRWPGSLQRMVRRQSRHIINPSAKSESCLMVANPWRLPNGESGQV